MIRIDIEAPQLLDPKEVVSPQLEIAMHKAVALLEGAIAESYLAKNTSAGATGAAARSIVGEVRVGEPHGLGTVLEMGDVVGVVGSPLAHVLVINDGRRPGQKAPKAEHIELWVRRALGVTDVKEARRVAFVVARAIGRKGIKPRRFWEKAFERNEATIRRIFEEAGHRITVRMTGRN